MGTNCLPLFPTPYPGESLYSVFCRYHVRSGNHAESDTMIQLFGQRTSLHSSLLTPYKLDCSPRWYSPGTGVDGMRLMTENTAYPYFAPFSHIRQKEICRKTVQEQRKAPLCVAMAALQVSTKTSLCYCPECAEEDRKRYGERYWHVLPQINGVEFCPHHKCRIVSSDIKLSDIRLRFIPAESVLDRKPGTRPVAFDPQIGTHYLNLAEDSNWLFKNGASLSHTQSLEFRANDINDIYKYDWLRKSERFREGIFRYIVEPVKETVPTAFLRNLYDLYGQNKKSLDYQTFMINSYVVRLVRIRALYGSVQELCESFSANDTGCNNISMLDYY